MKEEVISILDRNISVLSSIYIKNNHNETWYLNQLIEKNRLFLNCITDKEECECQDLQENCFKIISDIEKEVEYFIEKYL